MLQRLLLVFLALALPPVQLHAADSSFLGKWRLNPDKSTMHDQMKVTPAGSNRYAFDFGSGPEFIVVDGTDQPGLEGSTLAVTAQAPHVWHVVRKDKGRLEISAIWTLSADGHSLRDDFTGYPSNGPSFTIHYLYAPLDGASGFAAVWDSTSEKPGHSEIEVQTYEGDGLAFINAAQHNTKYMKFDGKEHPAKDAQAGTTTSANRTVARTLEFIEKRNGKVADTQQIQLSPDSKTLTMTIQPAGRQKADVMVFERE